MLLGRTYLKAFGFKIEERAFGPLFSPLSSVLSPLEEHGKVCGEWRGSSGRFLLS